MMVGKDVGVAVGVAVSSGVSSGSTVGSSLFPPEQLTITASARAIRRVAINLLFITASLFRVMNFTTLALWFRDILRRISRIVEFLLLRE